MKLAIVLLAAGLSRRFGSRDKLMAQLEGRPLAAHSLAALRGLPRHAAFVVLRHPGHAGLYRGMIPVRTPKARAGQGISLAIGIRAVRRSGASHVLLVLADMPRLTRSDLRLVARGALTHPVMALGGVAMPPAIIPRALFPRVMRLDRDKGAGALLRERPDLILRAIPADRLVDVDRPGDLPNTRMQAI
ncbi:nucleotidyltransferase family protein [Paracoccus sp. MBLB3053]|uniref:Nucleotidyltransferase family protein n=1 Tax=Paracoccus aurantius TaxID=3073814 RepID=A0ABU2HLZ1_9RHOB|nr:nucleotidyltransferase family protein [Paracoccus sp. MBLB3053]MDS9466057.1 nucleotidyltransferase family protein [Paracoccus sp. MBLB3053]